MPRNGSGVYSLPSGSTVANGDTSDATDVNTPLSDLETDANDVRPIVAGGTGGATASAARTALGVAVGTDVQAYNAGLAYLAGLAFTDEATLKAAINLEAGVDYQAYDADIASWATITRASGFDTLVATPTSANLASFITDETGSGSLVFSASPALTGTPTAPTAATTTDTTQIATTAFVQQELGALSSFARTMGSAIATTSGTTINLATGITGTVVKIEILFTDVSTSSTASSYVQLSTGGTFVTAGYVSGSDFGTYANSTAGLLWNGNPNSGRNYNGKMTLELGASNSWSMTTVLDDSVAVGRAGGTIAALGGAVDGVRLTRASGSYDNGSVTLVYYTV